VDKVVQIFEKGTAARFSVKQGVETTQYFEGL
jgi:hypothetical protein